MGSFKYKITIAYDGTGYSGWQVQPNAVSIQSLIEKALCTVLRAKTALTGSGRTDAGVHALAQTAHFTTLAPIDPFKTQGCLNGLLPPEIRVLSIVQVPLEFHARYSASSKVYHYHLHIDPVPNPFQRHYAYHFPYANLSVLKEAAAHFVGTYDFTSFASQAHRGSAAKDAIRSLYRLDVVEEKGGVRLEFEGSGFLYKMVRNIVGTLLDVSRGKTDVKQIPRILKAKDRRQGGAAAPAHGLYLVEVKYAEVNSECICADAWQLQPTESSCHRDP